MFALFASDPKQCTQVCETLGEGAAAPIVNLLTFSASWMQELWRQVAQVLLVCVDLPLEARSLDMVSLHGGAASLNRCQARHRSQHVIALLRCSQ